MAKITIDGSTYDLPPMKFKTLKKAYPLVMSVADTDDPIKMSTVAIEVISMAAIKKFPDLTPEFIEENMDAKEAKGLTQTMLDLMIESGLVTKKEATSLLGEADEAPQAPPSTGISTPSSQNSLPLDVPAETGISSKNDGD